MRDIWLFVWIPYLASATFFLGVVWRLVLHYKAREEGNLVRIFGQLWNVVAWRVGITGLIAAHIIGFLLPARVLAWNQQIVRLLALEVTMLAFACLAILGLARGLSLARRNGWRWSAVDSVALTLLAVVLGSGVAVALLYRWGSSWYVATLVPYLGSLLRLAPETEVVSGLPWLVHLHLVSGLLLVAMIPWTGLVASAPPWTLRRVPVVAQR